MDNEINDGKIDAVIDLLHGLHFSDALVILFSTTSLVMASMFRFADGSVSDEELKVRIDDLVDGYFKVTKKRTLEMSLAARTKARAEAESGEVNNED